LTVRLINAEEFSGLGLREAPLGNYIEDLTSKLRLCETLLGLRQV
jgi:hypothetical protein